MRALLVLVVLAGCRSALPPLRYAEPAPAPRFPADRKAKILAALPEIEAIYAEQFARSGSPGMAAGLVVEGELVWARGWGVRDLERRGPVGADSVFRIASMTKSFTAVAILQLRDAGKLSLDEPAARWVPELAELGYPTRDSRPITVRDLLTHTAGFPEDNASGDHTLDWSRGELQARLRRAALSSSPGAAWEYANLGFETLGLVVERASGEKYSDYVTRHVLEPLGMTSSRWDLRDVAPAQATQGYGRREPGLPFQPERQLANGAGAPMGGLYTSVNDLARYVAWQLSAWPPRDEADHGPLARASLREMQLAARSLGWGRGASTPEPPVSYAEGYGFGLGSNHDCELGWIVAHSGGLPGFGSLMVWLPDRGVGLITMTNQTYASGGRASYIVLRRLLRKGLLPERTRPVSPALARMRARVDGMLAGKEDVAGAFDPLLIAHAGPKALAKDVEGVRARHGACHATGEITPENALRGDWKLACERGGEVKVHVELTVDEKLQALDLEEKIPAGEPLTAAARQIVAALATGDPLPLTLHPQLDRERARAILAFWQAKDCTLGEATSGDGIEHAEFPITCGSTPRTLGVTLADGKLADFYVTNKVEQTCN